jgi:2-iminobutanoate/2-iminopropanoate deaminase
MKDKEKHKMNKKVIKTQKAPKAIGPYSQALQADNRLYISGQLGINPATGKLAEGSTAQQAKQVLENIKAILEEAGFELRDVVQVQVLLADIQDFGSVNEVYKQFFAEPYPARAVFEVAALPAGGKIEILAIAEK